MRLARRRSPACSRRRLGSDVSIDAAAARWRRLRCQPAAIGLRLIVFFCGRPCAGSWRRRLPAARVLFCGSTPPLVAGGSPAVRRAVRRSDAARSSSSPSWQIRTIAISTSVRPCMLTRIRAAVWSRIWRSPAASTAQAAGRRRATSSACDGSAYSIWLGAAADGGRHHVAEIAEELVEQLADLDAARRSPRRARPAPPPRRGPPDVAPAR